ncbi:hypothetical protein TNCV_1625161 [Trichonephila clavipes]|nr:hypothetical protein TNCV_1625161 [Trichonephila clavipes]
MCDSITQWFPKPSHLVLGLYADIKCKQVKNGLLGASRHVYGHHSTAYKTGTRPKRRRCATFVSSFVVRRTRVIVSLYAALSKLPCL